MALTRLGTLLDVTVAVLNPVGGTPAGSICTVPAPFRGVLKEVGFQPNSVVTSAMTLAVSVINNQGTASNASTQVVSSTLGTFSSTVLSRGAVASVIPPSTVYLSQGDGIQFTTSGGQTSAVGCTLYAIVRKA